MSKRRATDELYGDSAKRVDQTGRGAEFTAHLRALNSQFAQWAQQQAAQAGDKLWLAGVKDYIKHADNLLEQYGDVLVNGDQHRSSSPLASNLFGTPAPAADAPAAAADGPADAGGTTGRSSGFGAAGGRKSVTFAEQPSFGTTGPAAAATHAFSTAAGATTPGTANTANAGRTPAPASGLGFSFGATPGASKAGELPSPEPIKFGGLASPSSAGGAAGMSPDPSPSTGGFTFGTPAAGGSSGGTNFTPAGAAAAAAAAGPASGGSGFTFGVSSSSAPAGQDAAVAGNSSSSGAGFSFGGSPAVAAGSTDGFSFGASPASAAAAAAADGGSGNGPAATTSGFGAVPSSSGAAAGGGSSAPAFGFATTAAADSGTVGAGLFKFPVPTAAAGASGSAAAGGGAEADTADEEAPPKFKPELKVDEAVWNVLFSNKARLHVRVKKDNGAADWEGRGLGMLTVRQPKQGSSSGKTYVMFSTDVGKQHVASQLYNNSAVMPISNQPSKCRMSLNVLQYDLPPAGKQGDGAAPADKPRHAVQVCMLTLGSAQKVEEFTQVIEQHKPK